MIKITRTTVRPSTDVPFYIHNQEFVDYYIENYVDLGKTIMPTITLSDDTLTETTVSQYASQDVLRDFLSDQIVISLFIEPRTAYDVANGIVTQIE